MRILSLFDGLSCTQIALNNLGIKDYTYYASEIDKYAIQVTQKNYPDTIQIGDVSKIDFTQLGDIHLIVAGSPCQGFSFAGKQLNFNDDRSKLFFEFVRAIKELRPKYFLLENVKMKKEYQDVISKQLGVEPIEINSALLSAQNRKRLYWCNWNVEQPEDQGILLKDILLTNGDPICYSSSGRGNGKIERRLSSNDKAHTLTKTGYSNRSFSGVMVSDYIIRKLHPIECERLQTVPDNYTEGVSNTQRYKMLGNGFTVKVIEHILKGIL